MKKLIFITSFIFIFSLILPTFSFTQGIMNNTSLQNDNGHTAREEAEGKAVWEKLQAKELTCKDLSDDNFGTLGEYFMGQMMGNAHEAMNNMMIRMMGEEGEEQMHIVMGKRLSGCDTSAAFPSQSIGFMPMMNMMWGGWSSSSGLNQSNPEGKQASYGAGNYMMNFRFTPFGGFGWIFMILWWALIIFGIVALIKWLTSQSRVPHNNGRSSLEILKERYAKGEINKKEFEDKKKDL